MQSAQNKETSRARRPQGFGAMSILYKGFSVGCGGANSDRLFGTPVLDSVIVALLVAFLLWVYSTRTMRNKFDRSREKESK